MMVSHEKELILYIDDEKEHLDSFKVLFRKDYDVKTANSAKEGLEMMNNNDVRLVITDQRMPNMTGVQFLEKIADIHPNVPRVILTGYSDEEAIISAINKGKVFRYITKPWKKEELKKTIDFALETFYLKIENQELIESLKKINKELDEFVYRASHDLRAPLASILGLINLSKKEPDIKVIQEYIELKEKSVKKLDFLIRDIAQFSRNIHLGIRNEKINFEEVTNNAIELHRFFEDSPKINKSISINVEGVFYTDSMRLEVIINNLMSNAIRYSNKDIDNPTIEIIVNSNAESAEIKVIDNGIGIEKEYQDKIFGMFHQGVDHNTGSGLGLYIVKETVDKLKGKISVKSTLKKGTTFTVTLPNLLNPTT